MAEAISDRQVVRVLRPFVRAARPVLDAMRQPGKLEGLANFKVPGSAAWAAMDTRARVRWWINRVGRLTSLVTAIPGLGGALADRLPVQNALGASAQGLLLCAIADEHGIDDLGERVRLVAWVLFERDLDPMLAAGEHPEHEHAREDTETAELVGELGQPQRKKITLKSAAGALWRMGRSLLAVSGELDKRPRGFFLQRLVGMLPVAGMVGDYLAERSGLKRVAKRADRWLSSART